MFCEPSSRFFMRVEIFQQDFFCFACLSREGAPQIRALHRSELDERAAKRSKRKRVGNSSVTGSSNSSVRPKVPRIAVPELLSNSTEQNGTESLGMDVSRTKKTTPELQVPQSVVPLLSNQQFKEKYGYFTRRLGGNHTAQDIDTSADTPPLTSVPSNMGEEMPPLFLGTPKPIQSNNSSSGIRRSHSLALSDWSTGEIENGDSDFVNPFADESHLFNKVRLPNSQSKRNYIGKNKPQSSQSELPSVSSGVRNRSSLGNTSSRYVDTNTHPRPTTLNNCFCDCAHAVEDGGSCVCGDLADHLLHRVDGLAFFL